MKNTFAWIFVLSVPILIFLFFENDGKVFFLGTDAEKPLVTIGDVPLRVEVADTSAARSKGLSGRKSLGSTEGMLFVFDEVDYHGIWMKGMLISIDVIWIDEQLRVVDIVSDLRPETYPKIFEPSVPTRFVIETNANYVASFGIQIGDTVNLPKEVIPEDLQI